MNLILWVIVEVCHQRPTLPARAYLRLFCAYRLDFETVIGMLSGSMTCHDVFLVVVSATSTVTKISILSGRDHWVCLLGAHVGHMNRLREDRLGTAASVGVEETC